MPPIYFVPPTSDSGGTSVPPPVTPSSCKELDQLRGKKNFADAFQTLDDLHLTESASLFPTLAALPTQKDFAQLAFDCYVEKNPAPSWLPGLDAIGIGQYSTPKLTVARSHLVNVREWETGTTTAYEMRQEAKSNALFQEVSRVCGQSWPVKMFGFHGNGYRVKNEREVYLTDPSGTVIYGPDVISSYDVVQETARRLFVAHIGEGLAYFVGLDTAKSEITCAAPAAR